MWLKQPLGFSYSEDTPTDVQKLLEEIVDVRARLPNNLKKILLKRKSARRYESHK